jgi:hypothetical protein
MATKRKQCTVCKTHTIVRKVIFKAPQESRTRDDEIAWLCSPCVIELEEPESEAELKMATDPKGGFK